MADNSTHSAVGASSHRAGDDSGESTILSHGSAIAVILSSVGSALGYWLLPAQMRVHWTLGAGPYYGPEFAPTPVVLTVVPAIVAGVAVGAHLIDVKLHEAETVGNRTYHTTAVLMTQLVLLSIQATLIGVNL